MMFKKGTKQGFTDGMGAVLRVSYCGITALDKYYYLGSKNARGRADFRIA